MRRRAASDAHLGGFEGLHTALLLIHKREAQVYAIAVDASIDDTATFGRVIAVMRQILREVGAIPIP